MSSTTNKLHISLRSGLMFMFIGLPQTYAVTSSISDTVLGAKLYDPFTSCPTLTGTIVHVIVFFVLTYLSMWRADIDNLKKLNHTIYGTSIYFALSNPVTYKLTSSLLGNWIANSNGCPTVLGVILHSLVYSAILYGIMLLPD